MGLLLATAAVRCAAFGLAPVTDAPDQASWIDRVKNAISGPQGKLVDRFIQRFSDPVHEEITHLAYDCDRGVRECDRLVAGGRAGAPKYVLQGVQWNDNPPFRLTYRQSKNAPTCVGFVAQLPGFYPGCWGQVFSTAAQLSAAPGNGATFGPEAPILQRSHFGDMQFLHAMAPDGEPALITQRKIMAWAQFAYAVSQGDIAPGVKLSSAAAGTGRQFFPVDVNPAYANMDVRTLFTLGSRDQSPQRVKDMAFGSLLHIVQDSFSKAHVEREAANAQAGQRPGRVKEFHAYALQDHKRHSEADERASFDAADTKPVVVAAVRRLVEKRGAPWHEVESVLAEIFDVVDRGRMAGPGEAYRYKMADPNQQQAP